MYRAIVLIITLLLVLPVNAALNDPTRPPGLTGKSLAVSSIKKTQKPRWILTSTLVSIGRRTAIINDRVVSRGDRVNGATVIDIQPSSVKIRTRGRNVTLLILKKNVKSLSVK